MATRFGLKAMIAKLADAINLQGELASDIADALDATLSPQERRDVRSQSTRDPDAYVLYLQGRKARKQPHFRGLRL